MKLEKNDDSGYVAPKPGLTQGVIKSIIDVGTSEGKYGPKHEIMMVIALPQQTHIHDEAVGPEMLTISKWFSLSLNKKSNLRKFIESFQGEMDSDGQFEVMDLLGTNLMVHIVERTKDDGEKVLNVASAMPLSDPAAAVIVETSKFDLSEFKGVEFDALSEKLQARIRNSDEFKTSPF